MTVTRNGILAALHKPDCGDYRELPYFFGRDPARAVSIGGVLTWIR